MPVAPSLSAKSLEIRNKSCEGSALAPLTREDASAVGSSSIRESRVASRTTDSASVTDATTEESIFAIREMVTNHWRLETIFTGISLGVFDTFPPPPGNMTPLELATKLDLDESRCHRLLRALCSANVMTEAPAGFFQLNTTGNLLRKENANSMQPYLVLHSSTPMRKLWEVLPDALKKKNANKTTMELAYKVKDLAEYTAKKDMSYESVVSGGIGALLRSDNMAGLRVYSFAKFATVTDLMSGDGRLLCEIVARYPNMKGIIHKQSTSPWAKDYGPSIWPKKMNLESRVTEVPADRFTGASIVPSDCYIIRRVKVYSEARMVECFKAIHKVSPAHAKLVVISRLLPISCEQDPHGLALHDVHMMLSSNSRDRSYTETKDLFNTCGWKLNFADEWLGVTTLEFIKA
ncbi:hypothetical protein SmJEL517_g02767 [Synchytrium microbalum]|uniref:Uncharacterized protein n=1 Tax=Synchytrium microbalum TaxID=1806994 RepID=A0A507C6E2_9FUNG|nr:uncharacterized protein SmJEL517_g02767 [Synchytrium microbalum]TPX34679.1 hypothetical protein SmJEL517_g02767 [Synchytrium microbalum]